MFNSGKKEKAMIAYLKTRPYALQCGKGPRLQTLGTQVSVKANSQQTGGLFSLLEVSCSPGYATPLHIHYAEDVAIYVLEGALILFCGSEEKEGVAGSYFYQPRGTPHGFRIEGAMPARILYMTIPAGFDQFVMEQELPAPTREAEMDAARYKIETLGPLPESQVGGGPEMIVGE